MKLTSAYNFVPLNDRIYTPDWADLVSHDAPFSDGEDGVIEVTLRNVSPLFTRNGSSDRNNDTCYSAHIETADGKKLYYLPATNLKGMFRSVMEIMSFARLSDSQYTNRFFGYRNFGGKTIDGGEDYVQKMEGVKAGWLRKEREQLYLTPCDGEYKRIEYSEIKNRYPNSSYKDPDTGWKKNRSLLDFEKTGKIYPLYTDEYGDEYRIVCTGHINKKHKEFLFPIERLDEIPVTASVAKKFYDVHEPTPGFEGGHDSIKAYLEEGKELAVFYLPGTKEDEIDAIGLSSMLRFPYKWSVKELIMRQQGEEEQAHDLPQTIFGYTGKERSLKGRVQFCNAFSDKPLSDSELLEKAKGVLGQPKASFYPFYLKQESSPYKTYDNATGIAGRKQYRIHKGDNVAELPQGNENENTKISFRPIPKGLTFKLRIAIHNLRKVEIGALLSAITLHETQGAWHHLGLAKGFGYGKLEILNLKLNKFTYPKEEYMRAFEKEMTSFTKALTKPMAWRNTPQIVKLMGILGEHGEGEVKMMELKDYTAAKKKENFDLLKERENVHIPTFLKDGDQEEMNRRVAAFHQMEKEKATALARRKFARQHKSDYDQAEALRARKDFDEAIKVYQLLSEQRISISQDCGEEEKRIEELKHEKEAWLNERKQAFILQHQADYDQMELCFKQKDYKEVIDICDKLISQLQELLLDYAYETQRKIEAQKAEKDKGGLGAILNEKYPEDGPNAGQYKVKEFKVFMQKVNKWLKDKPEDALTEEERRIAWAAVDRLLPTGAHPKKEDKEVNNKDSKLWKWIHATLGERK